ncbi:ABC transporter substrate-binding protein [Prevotella scopos JCM 17725]|uniref:NitT/TauT family transport system substrate-binding protein n=1 Tax=Prevotella scopos JCM 17725 TaxID=1236518 RepID=A0AAX2F6S0_9BACT|nr:ABC transporter substrate-binding protein [Prevotella scopos]ANR74079.1 NLPA lipoprotein [Prevotella scopos JCM 17725]QUB44668.1 ABC transporter substrate-binding protein [Prevotella scopos JCM 17725]SHG10857.1 NitT/TauT family transport system substrate-binding protein [Prevotella scopos JCM 17725]
MKHINYLLLLAVLMLVGCGKSDKELQAERKAKQLAEREAYQKAYKIAVMPTMDCLPAYLLKDSLLYDTVKVDIRLCRFNAQMDCDTAMIGGSVQAVFSDLVRTERLKHRNKVLMHYLTDTNLNWQLIADKGSKLKKLSDLSDKIVAMTRYSGTDLLTDMVVKKAKPKYQVFRVQINDVFVRLAMLQNHEIDAYWFSEPQVAKALSADNNSLFNSEDAGVHLGVVAIMDKIRRQDEEIAFAEAYDKAVDQINKHGVKYYSDLIQKYMKVDEAVVRALPDIKYTKIGPPRKADLLMARNYLNSGKVSK